MQLGEQGLRGGGVGGDNPHTLETTIKFSSKIIKIKIGRYIEG